MNRALALMLLLAATPAVSPLAQDVQKPELAKLSLKVGDTAPDFHAAQRSMEKCKAQRLPRQEERFLGRLRPGFHRWLNETTSGGPGWNRLG